MLNYLDSRVYFLVDGGSGSWQEISQDTVNESRIQGVLFNYSYPRGHPLLHHLERVLEHVTQASDSTYVPSSFFQIPAPPGTPHRSFLLD